MNQDDELEEFEIEESEFTDLGTPELTDETINQEQINEMKMLGLGKPRLVSWERWQRIQDIRHEHEHMIHLAASGLPQGEIAKQLGYDHVHVSKVLRHPEVRNKISDRINEIYGSDHKKALKDRSLKAIKVVDEILESGKESEQASMAKWVLEHSIGKASQDVNVKTTSLVEVIHKINEMSQLRDVGSSIEALSKPEDPFDNVIKEVIPKGIIIGKRSSGDEGQTE